MKGKNPAKIRFTGKPPSRLLMWSLGFISMAMLTYSAGLVLTHSEDIYIAMNAAAKTPTKTFELSANIIRNNSEFYENGVIYLDGSSIPVYADESGSYTFSAVEAGEHMLLVSNREDTVYSQARITLVSSSELHDTDTTKQPDRSYVITANPVNGEVTVIIELDSATKQVTDIRTAGGHSYNAPAAELFANTGDGLR